MQWNYCQGSECLIWCIFADFLFFFKISVSLHQDFKESLSPCWTVTPQPSVGLSLWLPSYSWLVMAIGTWLRAAYSSFNIAHRQAWWKWAELDSEHWILSLGWRPGHLRSPWHFAQLQVEPDESIPCTVGSLTHPDGGSPSTWSLHSNLHKRGIERTDTQCIHSPSSQGSYQLLPHLLRQAVSSKITQYRKYTETYRMCSR